MLRPRPSERNEWIAMLSLGTCHLSEDKNALVVLSMLQEAEKACCEGLGSCHCCESRSFVCNPGQRDVTLKLEQQISKTRLVEPGVGGVRQRQYAADTKQRVPESNRPESPHLMTFLELVQSACSDAGNTFSQYIRSAGTHVYRPGHFLGTYSKTAQSLARLQLIAPGKRLSDICRGRQGVRFLPLQDAGSNGRSPERIDDLLRPRQHDAKDLLSACDRQS